MTEMIVSGRRLTLSGPVPADGWLLLQPVDEQDREALPAEAAILGELCPDVPFALAGFDADWFAELAPWPAPSPFRGQADFRGGAPELLSELTEHILPALLPEGTRPRLALGGYSLAGLFALWAAYETGLFEGAAAVSPSVWYPGWTAFAEGRSVRSLRVYLSLGDREEHTRNPVMRTVGDAIRAEHAQLERQGVPCALEWNAGNHFAEPERRTAKGFAWIMRRSAGSD